MRDLQTFFEKTYLPNFKKVLTVIGFMLLFAGGDMANAAITGTSPNPSGDTNISDDTIWKDENITLSGDIIIHPGGSLSLDNTALIFASTDTDFYGIEIKKGNATANGGRLKISNGSSVTVQNPDYNTWIYAEYEHPPSSKCPVIQASDSSFSELGKGIFGGDEPKRYGLEMRKTTSESYFDNITITNSYHGIYLGDGGEPVNITNCRIENIESSAIHIKYVGAYIYNNIITDIKFGVYAYETDGLQIIGNTFDAENHIGNYVIDIMARDKNFIFKDNVIKNFQRGIYLNGSQQNGLIENNTLIDGIGLGIGINTGGENITVKDNTVINTQDGIIALGNNILIYDNEIINPKYPTFNTAGIRIGGLHNSSIYNTSIRNVDQTTTTGINLYQDSSNLIIKKVTISGGLKYGITISNTVDTRFVDLNISDALTYDVDFKGLNENIKFINASFNVSKINFTDNHDVFLPYYYLDVKVDDFKGNPVGNAIVTISNEVDSNYSSINVKGESETIFVTGADGHTPLPSDLASSAAILDYWQTNTEKKKMKYTITAEKDGYTAAVIDIVSGESWYREEPGVYQNTITIILPMIQSTNMDKIKVYPNPHIAVGGYSGKVIFAGLSKEVTLRIYTVSGGLVKTIEHRATAGGGSVEWDISGISSGVYLFVAVSEEKKQTGKISIIK